MKIAIGSDHGGYELKEHLKAVLARRGMEVEDMGCHNRDSVDYPDYAREVAQRVSGGSADQGILVCRSGVGMSIAANKIAGVRAALCMNPPVARMARSHNDANVLVLAGDLMTKWEAEEILAEWTATSFEGGERHERRLGKVDELDRVSALAGVDPEIAAAVRGEYEREQNTLDLIASENYASRAVQAAQGCLMTNKYAEGYPGKRYYNGCEFVDEAERLALDRAKTLFGADHANVQPHCGSSANMAVYSSVLQPGDTILAMSLAHGGHLTHGHKVNFSGRLYNVVSYGVRRDTERIDYDEVATLAAECKPKLIVAGASAYPRVLDFERFRQIADRVGALLMVDMAHIAGLVAAGVHPTPVPWSDFVTTTTHKTLRGPRSGMVLCRERFAQELDRQVFPGLQGGPLMHTIAAKAVCFREALQPAFQQYSRDILRNAQTLARILVEGGLRLVSGGTDNHLMLVDLTPFNTTGRDAATALEKAGITVNKNAIPFDPKPPAVTSGVRLGTPAITTRGLRESETAQLAEWILDVLKHPGDEARQQSIRAEVATLCRRFPIP
jgi:glycine hydroxymethyltransferase